MKQIKEFKEMLIKMIFEFSLLAIAVLLFLLMKNSFSDEQNETKCEMINSENNIVEMICKNDMKIIKKVNNLTYEEWEQFKEKFNCKYTGHNDEFKCDNNIQIKRHGISFIEWRSYRDENHCRLVKIDETVRENQNYWLCDNNININNNFYK